MTDRDEFAKAALAGLCTDSRNIAYRGAMVIAEDAYRCADAMLAEREKSQPAKEGARPLEPKGGDADVVGTT